MRVVLDIGWPLHQMIVISHDCNDMKDDQTFDHVKGCCWFFLMGSGSRSGHILADTFCEQLLVLGKRKKNWPGLLTEYGGYRMVYYYIQMHVIGDCSCNRCVFFLASLDNHTGHLKDTAFLWFGPSLHQCICTLVHRIDVNLDFNSWWIIISMARLLQR